jgi:DNA (cytosine-5)-methyltransferase 1
LHCARPNTSRDLEIYKRAVDALKHGTRLKYTDLPSRLQTQHNVTSFLDRFKVVDGESAYSQTVVAHIAKDGHYFIHPDATQNRSLTPREAARIQTFPDNYYFEGVKEDKASRTAAFKQIGNAVPVRLAEVIANAMPK